VICECGKTTMNQTIGKAIIQLIFLIEHLELLEHRATSTAAKTTLFCAVSLYSLCAYSRAPFALIAITYLRKAGAS